MRTMIHIVAPVAMFLLVNCAGCGSSSPPPPRDFSLSVSPSAISMTVGTVGPAVGITASGQNGFADTVNVAIAGLPPGAFSSPPVWSKNSNGLK